MPLPPLPPETTPRLYIKYTSMGNGHTVTVRLPLTGTAEDAAARFNAVKADLAAFLPTVDAVNGADFSAAGTNIRFPLAVTGVQGTAEYFPNIHQEALEVTVTGRSLDGRKARIGFFSPSFPPAQLGYRISGITGPGAGIWGILTGDDLDARSISGGDVVWNNYVNIGYNDHWVSEERSNA